MSLFKTFRLFIPLIIFGILLTSFFCITEKDVSFDLPLGLSNFFSFSFSINNKILFKIVYLIICFSVMLPYLFFDYSTLFPSHLKMEVFFDKGGIEETVKSFRNDELKELKINLDSFDKIRDDYFYSLDY